MKSGRVVPALLALLVLAGSALAQKTSVDYDHDADFTKYKKYAWTEGTHAKDPFAHERIVAAIEGQLAAKGLTRVQPDENPDIFVLYQAAVTEQKEAQVWGTGYGAGWRWGGGTAQVSVNTILIGQLVVDIGDAATKKLVWRGRASDTLSDKPEKNEKKINKAAEKLFKNFPPAKK
jgi:hypothetical protein